MFEDFPDTDSAATEGKVFEEVTEDAAVVDVDGEVDVRAELHEGNKSNDNNLNDLLPSSVQVKFKFSPIEN